MPIYLVRWPDLSASLVRAPDEDELLDILDQVDNSEGCVWSVYDGPLFIDFRLPVEWSVEGDRSDQPISPDQIAVGKIGRLAEGLVSAIQLSLADGEDGCDTGAEVIRRAFPELQAAVDKHYTRGAADDAVDDVVDDALPEAEIRKALQAELARVVQTSWRHAQLRNKQDRASELALQMGMPVALAQRYVAAAEASVSRDDPSDEPDF